MEPFISQISMFGFNFAPRNWAMCDGQIIPLNENQTLYALIGTFYGGDGRSTLALPDLRGRVPVGIGDGYNIGGKAGLETVTLTAQTMPQHTHLVATSSISTPNTKNYTSATFASATANLYGSATNLAALNADSISHAGGTSTQAHINMQPSTVINFCIAMQGLFPSRN